MLFFSNTVRLIVVDTHRTSSFIHFNYCRIMHSMPKPTFVYWFPWFIGIYFQTVQETALGSCLCCMYLVTEKSSPWSIPSGHSGTRNQNFFLQFLLCDLYWQNLILCHLTAKIFNRPRCFFAEWAKRMNLDLRGSNK